MLTAAGAALVESDKPQKADAIVVLGGDEFGCRIITAANLQKAGYAPIVLVSGPPTLLGHESDMTIEFARRKGYPASMFQAVNNGLNSTRAETQFLGRYLKEHGMHKILLVTSNYHTGRAARLMRDQNPSLDVRAIAAPDPNFTPSTWWLTREGQKKFVLEWAKTIATLLGK